MEQVKKSDPPGYMVVKPDVMKRVLDFDNQTVFDFAGALDVEIVIAYAILSGEKMGIAPSRSFINHYTAEFAHRYIDWVTMGMSDPYRKIRKRNVKIRYYDRRNIS